MTGLLRTASFAAKRMRKTNNPMKSKQRAVTAAERDLWHRIAALGCCACAIDGNENPFVSIHHVDGRTKPGCHERVLPLCAQHHQQDDTDPLGRIAVHPFKHRFEAKYGSQADLLQAQLTKLGGMK